MNFDLAILIMRNLKKVIQEIESRLKNIKSHIPKIILA